MYAYLLFELADATNYVNDVGPGVVLLLHTGLYNAINTESYT